LSFINCNWLERSSPQEISFVQVGVDFWEEENSFPLTEDLKNAEASIQVIEE
jgi:hypothetical protein